ncbi:hypothetical protein J1N35_001328 [Gossypium stocksii]|uniref:Reverse transcriptase zinc-binding domain-containing protein n=1 Tax=Gossypium stocksii TaxID=47602 RepID=A0A9D3WJQ0_9ROSI|nr:hypothetical protein J1N35_001328 [Gossypium stocksii]
MKEIGNWISFVSGSQKISSGVLFPPLHLDEGLDRISRLPSLIRAFSVRSACRLIRENSWNSKEEASWKFKGPHRVLFFFLWLVFKQCLSTNLERVRRGIGQEVSCPFWEHSTKDIIHVLRNYPATKEVWDQVVPLSQYNSFFSFNLSKRLLSNLLSFVVLDSVGVNWESLFGYVSTGGVVRNHLGEWIMNFNHFLGTCFVFDAEL